MKIMENYNNLNCIAEGMEAIGTSMKKEAKVYEAELADRKKLGLTGDAAIAHYNDWMERNGMEYLKTK